MIVQYTLTNWMAYHWSFVLYEVIFNWTLYAVSYFFFLKFSVELQNIVFFCIKKCPTMSFVNIYVCKRWLDERLIQNTHHTYMVILCNVLLFPVKFLGKVNWKICIKVVIFISSMTSRPIDIHRYSAEKSCIESYLK